MSLTDKERRSIRDDRDEGKPQLPLYGGEEIGWQLFGYCDEPMECNHLEVNHIINQADGGTDDPYNLLTIPKCIHVGVCPSGKIKDEYALRRGKRTK